MKIILSFFTLVSLQTTCMETTAYNPFNTLPKELYPAIACNFNNKTMRNWKMTCTTFNNYTDYKDRTNQNYYVQRFYHFTKHKTEENAVLYFTTFLEKNCHKFFELNKKQQTKAFLLLGWQKETIKTFSQKDWINAHLQLPDNIHYTSLKPITTHPIAVMIAISINPHLQDTTYQSILHILCRHISKKQHYSEALELLLAHPMFDPKKQDKYGNTGLHYLCINDSNKEKVQILLNDPATNPNTTNKSGYTAYHWAHNNNALQIMALLKNDSRFNQTIQNPNLYT